MNLWPSNNIIKKFKEGLCLVIQATVRFPTKKMITRGHAIINQFVKTYVCIFIYVYAIYTYIFIHIYTYRKYF